MMVAIQAVHTLDHLRLLNLAARITQVAVLAECSGDLDVNTTADISASLLDIGAHDPRPEYAFVVEQFIAYHEANRDYGVNPTAWLYDAANVLRAMVECEARQ